MHLTAHALILCLRSLTVFPLYALMAASLPVILTPLACCVLVKCQVYPIKLVRLICSQQFCTATTPRYCKHPCRCCIAPQMLNVVDPETLAKGLLICRAVPVIILTIFITCVHHRPNNIRHMCASQTQQYSSHVCIIDPTIFITCVHHRPNNIHHICAS